MPYKLENDSYDTPTRYTPEEWDDIVEAFIRRDYNKSVESTHNENEKYPLENDLEDCRVLENIYPYNWSEQQVIHKKYAKHGHSCMIWLDDFVVFLQCYYDPSDYVSGHWWKPIKAYCLPRNPTIEITQ